MRPVRLPPQCGDAVDALVTDQYLDALMASGDCLPARDDEAPRLDAAADGELRHAVEVVRSSLVRVHPSFRFEERLAGRLADLAVGEAVGVAAAGGSRAGGLIPFPGVALAPVAEDPLLQAVLDGSLDPADAEALARAAGVRTPAKPLIVGGAITSAAISLVGVAWVAWRASRPSGSTMARAAREAHARRLADLAELAAGVHGGHA